MKKLLALVLALGMVMTLAACGGGDTGGDPPAQNPGSTTSAPPASTAPDAGGSGAATEYADLKIAALLAGPSNDNGWNATAYNALNAIAAKYSLNEPVAISESVAASDMEEFLRGYAIDGYNMIVCHGSQFVDAVHKVAAEFPDSKFVVSYAGEETPQSPNVAGVGPVNSGFLAGAVAAACSKTGKIVMLGGQETPSITELVDMFEPGAKYINPDIEVTTAYIGTLTDADKAKEVALNYAKQGYDVLTASANNAGLGVLQAAQEAEVMAIGYNADQYDQAPEAVVVSVVRDFQHMFDLIFQEIGNGTFESKVYSYGIKDGGTVLSDWHGWDQKLPETKATMDQLFKDLEEGKLDK